MLAAANAQFPGDVTKRDEMVALNPYKPGENICKYCVVARLTVEKGIHISDKDSHFTHSDSAMPVVAGKVTSKMLLKEKSFVATVANFGGKAPEKVMRAEAEKLGFGGDAASEAVFWRVNAMVRHNGNSCWEGKWAALQGYLKLLKDEANVFTAVKVTYDYHYAFCTIIVNKTMSHRY